MCGGGCEVDAVVGGSGDVVIAVRWIPNFFPGCSHVVFRRGQGECVRVEVSFYNLPALQTVVAEGHVAKLLLAWVSLLAAAGELLV